MTPPCPLAIEMAMAGLRCQPVPNFPWPQCQVGRDFTLNPVMRPPTCYVDRTGRQHVAQVFSKRSNDLARSFLAQGLRRHWRQYNIGCRCFRRR